MTEGKSSLLLNSRQNELLISRRVLKAISGLLQTFLMYEIEK